MAKTVEIKKKEKEEEVFVEETGVVSATARYVRMSPRKLRLVADMVRGDSIADARVTLSFSPRAAAKVIDKLISSAVANAENNHDLNGDDLFVSRVLVNGGPVMKRIRARAMGRAARIRKRTSHVTVELSQRSEE
ncbi:MAG: 50S ribosomal protein L22 [Actinomycetota bacterium]